MSSETAVPATETSKSAEMVPLLATGVTEVFSTMLNFTVQGGLAASDASLPGGEQQVASAVGFVGKMNGVVYIYTTASFARTIASRMLGIPDNEIEGDEMVNDVMGELANMVVGQMKANLSTHDGSCLLTVPSILRGSNFTVEPVSSDTRQTLCFDCNQNKLLVQILIKP